MSLARNDMAKNQTLLQQVNKIYKSSSAHNIMHANSVRHAFMHAKCNIFHLIMHYIDQNDTR